MRYLPLTDTNRREMLSKIGASSINDLFSDVPAEALLNEPVDLPLGQSEMEVEREMVSLAGRNISAGAVPSFLGTGAYRHHVPATVDYVIQRGEFLTAYTPYQPEIAQGTLQALFEFQTQVALITDMDVANASLYDGATAAAEAALMANRVTRREKIIASGNLHPHYSGTIATLSEQTGFQFEKMPPTAEGSDIQKLKDEIDGETSAVIVQYPDVFGHIVDFSSLAEATHAAGALLIVVTTEIVSLGAIKPPGAMGADIAVAEGQSIGNALNFGGPHIGLFACKEKLIRQMPGRLCGETVDAEGRRGFVLTLSTREQHIRRAKATSNICTNSGLCALAFTVHMTLLGETGFKELAALNHARACQLADRLSGIPGVNLITPAFFNEFALKLPKNASEVVQTMADAGVLGGVPASRLWSSSDLDDVLIVAATETNTNSDIDALVSALEGALV